jgi:wobble nucleotide-excising tRNase
MQIKREEFLKELNEELQLREYVRNAIRLMNERNTKEEKGVLNETKKLRSVIQTLLSEVKIQSPEESPHESTGINYLRSLLKRILPGALEDDYKALTTDKSQRDSFRAHIINAVQDTLAPRRVTDDAGGVPALTEAEEAEDIDITIEDSDGMPGE